MQRLRRHHFRPAWTRILAGAAFACIGIVAEGSAAHAGTVTFSYTGADVMYTIDPGTYRITVYGAQGGNASQSTGTAFGGYGAGASAIYKVGQTLNLRIGVGGQAPEQKNAAGGGGASFVDFVVGDPGLGILLLVGGGGGGGYLNSGYDFANGDNGKTSQTDPGANGLGGGGGGGGGYSNDGQSTVFGGQGGQQLLNGGAPGLMPFAGGFGGGGAGAFDPSFSRTFGGGGGGGYNGGNAGLEQQGSNGYSYVTAQGGTSFVNDNPDGCGPDGGPACFVGGLVLSVGEKGNGSVTIESVTGLAIPEPPSIWLIMIGAVAMIGLPLAAGRTPASARSSAKRPLA